METCNSGGLMMVLGLKSVIYVFFMIFPLFLRFSLIFMNMQIRYFASQAIAEKKHMSNLQFDTKISSL